MDGRKGTPGRRARKIAVIQSLQRGLGILEFVARNGSGVTTAQVSREIGLHTSTTFHLLRTLTILGYLVQDEATKRYRLGSKVFGLAAFAYTEIQLLQISASPLTEMATQTGDTSHLAIFDRGEVIMINRVEGSSPVGLSERVGISRPAHCSAIGKVLLAHLTEAELKAYLERHGLKRFTPRTITTPSLLRQELARVRKQGYAFDDEELARGIRCLAAPVRNFAGQVVAAVGISAPVWRLRLDRVAQLTQLVKAIGQRLSQRLGYPADSGNEIAARWGGDAAGQDAREGGTGPRRNVKTARR
jgi:IclR family acetate operon transcriptional repressor